MRIGIDARLYKEGLGIGRYIECLLRNLESIDSHDEYVIFLKPEMMQKYNPLSPRFTKVCLDISWYSLAEQLILPFVLLAHSLDIVHFPHFNVPVLYSGKFVVTIHDLIMMKHVDSSRSAASTKHSIIHWCKYQAYKIVMSVACFRAKRIITVSQCVKNDLIRILSVPEKKISVIYEGVQLSKSTSDEILPKHVRKPYFINVGNAYPHKNINHLLNVFEELLKSKKPYKLILCGQEDYFRERVLGEIKKRNLEDTVVHLGYVSDAYLAYLYQNAQAALFPSFEEGFGFGPLEAAMVGTPVIASDILCFREVFGDAALYVDPTSVHDMIQAIQMLETDVQLRSNLIQKGAMQIRLFSWKRTAQQTSEIYHLLSI